ncbi:C6 zinc finger domain protein [Ilyonectria destructans]|nr:C6 zinc finger domain protein [Ilyonectria destructans]
MSASRRITPDVCQDEPGCDSSIHPAQQRLSCEGCRKHKAKCQRINADDPKCGRCLMYKIDCNVGRQRRIGRPRRVAVAKAAPQSRLRGADDTSRPGQLVSTRNPTAPPSLPASTSLSSSASDTPALLNVGLASFTDAAVSPESTLGASVPIPSMAVLLPTPHTPLSRPRIEHPPSLSRAPAATLWRQPSVETISVSLATLSLINMDLHNRMQASEAHKHVLDLNLIIFRRGPLFIDNLALIEFTLKVSREYLSVLTNLHSAVSHQKSLASTPLRHNGLPTSPRAPYQPLTAPVTLAITSIFVQLLGLYELNLKYLLTRLESINAEPIASTRHTFRAYNIDDRCRRGAQFIGAFHNLLQQMEVLLGISWGPEHGDGLLSPRQMYTLWNEISDEFGSSITRPDSIKSSMQKAIWMIRQLLANLGVHGLDSKSRSDVS